MTSGTAHGRFEIVLTPGDGLLAETGRLDFTKVWTGDFAGEGVGVMLSAGDPSSGAAGYVAIETVTGSLAGRSGGFAFLQQGLMSDGQATIRYAVAPGSGTGALVGITGSLEIDPANGHAWVLTYALPD